ncbi:MULTISPECIES: HlyD family secretion protein [unclassified Prochlorococcus]|uniref:HlyD family secretion protein n=1 Tax=unclassified Prochlorococcus TaxID=2627481 RepID=UPI000563F982|nr:MULTISPECIES: hypothetical protein [unclassified Prochlorococcus]
MVTNQPFALASYGLGAFAVCLLIWACLYKVNATVNGIGFTLNQGRNVRAYTRVAGRVTNVYVSTGQQVDRNQRLASIDNRVQEIEANSYQQIKSLSNNLTPQQVNAKVVATRQSIDGMARSKIALGEQLKLHQAQLSRYQKLLDNKDISQAEYLSQLNEVESIKTQLLQLQGSIEEKQSDLLQLEISAKSSQITINSNAALSANQSSLSKDIVANAKGVISVIDISEGDYLQEGVTIATISLETGPAQGVFLVSAKAAKRVKPNNLCFLSPAETPASKYGYLLSKVKSIGKLPTNPQELTRILGLEYTANALFDQLTNRAIAEEFSAFPYLLVVSLSRTEQGHLKWTTTNPPEWGFSAGGAASVDCVYDTWSPITYLIPLMRRNLGYGR